MHDKHAVWCQCASVCTFLLACACICSIRTFSINIDLYWSFVLCLQCLAQFCAAEHMLFFGRTPAYWHDMEDKRSYACKWIIAGWSFFMWSNINALFVTLSGVASTFVPWKYRRKHQYLILPVVSAILLLNSPLHIRTWSRTIPFVVCERVRRTIRLKNTSTADLPIRRQYFWRACGICAESILYWSFRCTHRFPHTIRYTGVLVSLLAVLLAFVYCHYNIAPTRVSANSIIKSDNTKHWMAASIEAAKKCTICAGGLSALDVESSFKET